MHGTQLEALEQIEVFLSGARALAFIIENKTERYQWIQRTLVRFNYLRRSKAEKGWVMRYLAKITGYSPAQVKRLIKPYRESGQIVRKHRTAKGFTQK